MPNSLDEETERIHLHLYKRDIARIHALRGRAQFNKVVRNMIRKMLDQMEQRALASATPIKSNEKDFDLG